MVVGALQVATGDRRHCMPYDPGEREEQENVQSTARFWKTGSRNSLGQPVCCRPARFFSFLQLFVRAARNANAARTLHAGMQCKRPRPDVYG